MGQSVLYYRYRAFPSDFNSPFNPAKSNQDHLLHSLAAERACSGLLRYEEEIIVVKTTKTDAMHRFLFYVR